MRLVYYKMSGSDIVLKKIILWILVIITCCMIFNFSSKIGKVSNEQSKAITQKVENIVTEITDTEQSKTTFDDVHNFIRKQGHFIEFTLLGIFLFLLVRSYDISVKKSLIITLLFVLFYACTDEIHQLFVDGRNGNIKDVGIDFLGGAVGALITLPFEKKHTK